MIRDHYYVQCVECKDGWSPLFVDKDELAQYYSYSYGDIDELPDNFDFDQKFNGDVCANIAQVPAGKIINQCVQGPTSAPSMAPTDSPTDVPPVTAAPSCMGNDCGETQNNGGGDGKQNAGVGGDSMIGAVLGGLFAVACVAFIVLKQRKDRREKYDGSDDDSSREGSGFEMQNPMKVSERGGGGLLQKNE